MIEQDPISPSIKMMLEEDEIRVHHEKSDGSVSIWSKVKGELLTLSMKDAKKLADFITFARETQVSSQTNTFLLDHGPELEKLSNIHKSIINIISSSEDGITFPELCNKLGFNRSELQGHLGRLTIAWQGITGSSQRPWVIRNKKYFIFGAESEDKKSCYHTKIENLKKSYPNAYERWSSSEEQLLIQMWNNECSLEQISNKLGRNRGGITSRLSKLGFIQLPKDISIEPSLTKEQVDKW